MASSDDDSARVAAALAQPSYTPARRDLARVAALITSDDEALSTRATRALLRADPRDGLAAVVTALAAASDAAAVRLVATLGLLARAPSDAGAAAAAQLVTLLESDVTAPRVRRAAIVALGKAGGDAAATALAAYATRPDLPADHRRALVEALGKVGGPGAAASLAMVSDPADAELVRRKGRALLMVERDQARAEGSAIRGEVEVPAAVTVVARCRKGIEGLLEEELRAAGFEIMGSDTAAVRVRGRALGRFQGARTWVTIGIERGIRGGLVEGVVEGIVGARGILGELTEGLVRWRLGFEGGGHRRAAVWEIAKRVRDAAPELVNDPRETTWDVVVGREEKTIELRPRKLEDARFAWRVSDVSAASHPTIAAAIARVAGVEKDDVVWDPFCGSGSEIIERGRLGAKRLIGSDLDARALEAARRNVDAAGLEVELVLANALEHDPRGVTLIVTNPPLGRRLRGDPGPLLEQFVARAARVVRPGGRLVWITPVRERTERAATRAGWKLEQRLTVDLGGYDADLERWRR